MKRLCSSCIRSSRVSKRNLDNGENLDDQKAKKRKNDKSSEYKECYVEILLDIQGRLCSSGFTGHNSTHTPATNITHQLNTRLGFENDFKIFSCGSENKDLDVEIDLEVKNDLCTDSQVCLTNPTSDQKYSELEFVNISSRKEVVKKEPDVQSVINLYNKGNSMKCKDEFKNIKDEDNSDNDNFFIESKKIYEQLLNTCNTASKTSNTKSRSRGDTSGNNKTSDTKTENANTASINIDASEVITKSRTRTNNEVNSPNDSATNYTSSTASNVSDDSSNASTTDALDSAPNNSTPDATVSKQLKKHTEKVEDKLRSKIKESLDNEIEMNDIVKFNTYICNLNNSQMINNFFNEFSDTTNTTSSNTLDSYGNSTILQRSTPNEQFEDSQSDPKRALSDPEGHELVLRDNSQESEVTSEHKPIDPEVSVEDNLRLDNMLEPEPVEDLRFKPKPVSEDKVSETKEANAPEESLVLDKVLDQVIGEHEKELPVGKSKVSEFKLKRSQPDFSNASNVDRRSQPSNTVNTDQRGESSNNFNLYNSVNDRRLEQNNQMNLNNNQSNAGTSSVSMSRRMEEDDYNNICTPKNKKMGSVNLKGLEMIKSNSDKLIKTINYTLNKRNKRSYNDTSNNNGKRKRYILINPNNNHVPNTAPHSKDVVMNKLKNQRTRTNANPMDSARMGMDDKVLERNCSSEMWNDDINVIIYRKMKLGYGSFSTVSLALLRFINQKNQNNEGEAQPADAATTENTSTAPNNGPPATADTMEKKRIYECAIKNINNNYGEMSRYQYIREKEMMLHYNQNVLKPISYRILYNNNNNKLYQLLLPRAKGDLLSMLIKLIIYRTNTINNKGNSTTSTKRNLDTSTKNNGESSEKRNNWKFYGLFIIEIKYILIQIINSIIYIHNCFQGNILRHTDIKLNNILVFCSEEDKYNPLKWQLNLSDFGSSILLQPNNFINNIQNIVASTQPTNFAKTTAQYSGNVKMNDDDDIFNYHMNEYMEQINTQLLSYNIGTLKYNSPETLLYDEFLNKRINNNRALLDYFYTTNNNNDSSLDIFFDKDNSASQTSDGNWSDKENSQMDPLKDYDSLKNMNEMVEINNVRYIKTSNKSDIWSLGIIITELVKYMIHYDFNNLDDLANVNLFNLYITDNFDCDLNFQASENSNSTTASGLNTNTTNYTTSSRNNNTTSRHNNTTSRNNTSANNSGGVGKLNANRLGSSTSINTPRPVPKTSKVSPKRSTGNIRHNMSRVGGLKDNHKLAGSKSSNIKNILYNNIGNGIFYKSKDKMLVDDENRMLSTYINNVCNNEFKVRKSKLLRLIYSKLYPKSDDNPESEDKDVFNPCEDSQESVPQASSRAQYDLLINLLTNLLSYYPSERLNSIEILGHEFFTNSRNIFKLIDHNNKIFVNKYYNLYENINSSDLNLYDDKYSYSWYKGPLYYYVYISSSNLTASVQDTPEDSLKMIIYNLEYDMLMNKSRELYGDEFIIYKLLKKLKIENNLNYRQITSTYTSHLLSRELYLLNRHKYQLE
ncbi:Protein kinase domain protein [Theileria parva strain Muguga]|uniref:Serine/threonine protein kinase, putative n=1 Tax=Theileria parva TaxID=5875 RepID=Q4N7T9_THEPA|nr:Protein kinase domain protein [Theileria parva strain Muguga]EAN33969.1 Protein kinase domain protein [Theileria parva strain Muguga]|eukprot:XP_766252.1 serine/threonine protein kinase [Theileria parva strain Muguga]